MDRRHQLSLLLEHHHPTGPRETDHRRRMLAHLAAPADQGDPFSRDCFRPGHFTASAFVISMGEPDGAADWQLLMIHHRRLDRWLQPGGHVEPDDADLGRAAQREAWEETGLEDLKEVPGESQLFDLDIHPIPERGEEPRHLHLDVRFLFQASSRALLPATDAKAARWVNPSEAALLNPEPAMTRVLRKLGSLHPITHTRPKFIQEIRGET